MNKNKIIIFICFLILFCSLLFGYKMGSIALSDPDEVFYAETAKEMINFKSFLTPMIFGKPQFEKPPLFYWLIVISSRIFGFTDFAVRFVSALFGTMGIMGIFFLAKRMFNIKTAIYASFILATNFLYLGLSRCALTDIVFSAFIILSLSFFYLGYKDAERRRVYFCLFFLSCVLATLTKGPLGTLIPIFCIIPYLALEKDLKFLKSQVPWVLGILIFVCVAFPWYVAMAIEHQEFLKSFLFHENIERFFVAEHKSFNRWYFYPVVLFASTFPWSILFPLLLIFKENEKRSEFSYLKCWFWFPLIFFTAAQSKLASYILPIYPAMCLVLARAIERIEFSAFQKNKLIFCKILSTVLALAYLSAFVVSIVWLKAELPQFLRIYFYAVIFITGGIVFLIIFLWLNRYSQMVFVNTAAVFIFIMIIMSHLSLAQGTFSEKDLVAFIKQNPQLLKETIVCSKLYARGAYFYTGKNVIVINDDKSPFFRPHPIEVMSADWEIINFFKTKESVLCVLTKENFERLSSEAPNRANKILYQALDRYVILSQALQNP